MLREFRAKQIELSGSVDFTKKVDGSIVTKLDVEIDSTLQERLKISFPEIPIFGGSLRLYRRQSQVNRSIVAPSRR